ncbi:FAD/NAD(P)-binding oxidoreductase [Carex rostrata]
MATCTFSSKPFLPSLHFSKRPLASISRFSRRISVSASATTATWTPAPLSLVSPATSDSSVFHVVADLSSSPSLSTSYSAPGQYLQLKISGSESKPAFMAIASPPTVEGRFEFLVKRVPGSTAELICGLKEGDLVELGPVMGKGFPIERIKGPEATDTVFIFATGTGISAIRSLIESDFPTNKKADVRLYYGARNLQIMAYQDRFETWESSGVTVVPVLSQPDNSWIGETGYVQDAFLRTKPALNPSSTGVVLCGHKQMAEEITSALVADGVPKDKILMNF